MEPVYFLGVLALIAFPILVLVQLSNLRAEQRDVLDRIKTLQNLLRLRPPADAAPQPVPVPLRPIVPPAPAAENPVVPAEPPPAIPRMASTPPLGEMINLPPPLSHPPRPRPPPAPEKPSKLAETTAMILSAIWNWILVGEEHRPRNVSAEYAVASTWLLRVGILFIIGCASFFLQWSIKNGLLGPEARVGLSTALGIGMLLGGLRLLGRRYHLIGQGLLGGGIVILYASMYSAGPPMFKLLPQPMVFGLMILVTITAALLAVRLNALLIAILGLAGGYATPVLLADPGGSRPMLYSYMTLLTLGILGVAARRNWRLLNYLAFIATYVLFFLSLTQNYTKADFPVALGFLSVFFVIHSALTMMGNLIQRRPAASLDLAHLLANALFFSVTAYFLIHHAHGRPYPALMSAGLAAFYIAHVLVFLNRGLKDRALLITLLALSAGFTVWTLPLVMEKETLTLAFALLALVLLWLGRRLGSRVLELVSNGLYLFVVLRLAVFDFPRDYSGHGGPATWAAYWPALLDRLWTLGGSTLSFVAAFFIQRRAAGQILPPAADVPEMIPARILARGLWWLASLLVFVLVLLEFDTAGRLFEPARLPALSLLCAGLAVWFLLDYRRTGSGFVFAAAVVAAGIVVLKLFAWDLDAWLFSDWIYDAPYSALAVCMRLLDFGGAIGLFVLFWRLLRAAGREDPRTPRHLFGYGSLALLFVWLTLETTTALALFLPAFRNGGLSVLWAVFAIAFLVAGIARALRPLRAAGLILFVVVIGKVLLVDLSGMETIYRVLAFFVVGLLLLFGAVAYIRGEAFFKREE